MSYRSAWLGPVGLTRGARVLGTSTLWGGKVTRSGSPWASSRSAGLSTVLMYGAGLRRWRFRAAALAHAPPRSRHGHGHASGLRAQGNEMSGLLSSSMLTSLKVTTRTDRTKRLER